MKKRKFLIGVFVILVVTILIIGGYKILQKRVVNDELSINLIWDNKTYNGMYQGKIKGGIPYKEGVFTSKDDELLYEGTWSDSSFSGKGKITYKDGTYEEGTFKNGIRNGEFRFYKSDGIFQVINYDNGIAVGNTYFYENGVMKKVDKFYNGVLREELKKQAEKFEYSAAGVEQFYNKPIYVDVIVKDIFQTQSECYLKLNSNSGQTYICNYNNTKADDRNQALMPCLKVGDKIRLYGYYKGISENEIETDLKDYGYAFPELVPFFAEFLDKDNYDIYNIDDSYNMAQLFPYEICGIKIEREYVVDAIVKQKSNIYYIKVHDLSSIQEQYYLYYKADGDIIVPGENEKIKIKGVYDGIYKESKIPLGNDIKKGDKNSESKFIQTENSYNLYPLIEVEQMEIK